MKHPFFIYGTAWKEDRTAACVLEAVRAGFRAIDTANQRKHYFEEAVGDALQKLYDEGTVTREDLFLQSKFTHQDGQDHRLPYNPRDSVARQVRQSFDSTLVHLRTDRLDSLLLHGPSVRRGLAPEDWDAWGEMEAIHREGKAAAIGVSNMSAEQLQLLCEGASIKPAAVQNRCYARTGWDSDVRQLCGARGIAYQAFSLLTANPQVLAASKMKAVTERSGITPEQAVFAFSLAEGMVPLTGTTSPLHMKQDLAVSGIRLDREDISILKTLS